MRADLRALTPETLAELSNRGLVKRATRDLEREAPAVTEGAGGVVRAVFPDGTTTELPTGGLEAGSCGCGAPGVCRHVIGLVLAYQQLPVEAADAAGASMQDRPGAPGRPGGTDMPSGTGEQTGTGTLGGTGVPTGTDMPGGQRLPTETNTPGGTGEPTPTDTPDAPSASDTSGGTGELTEKDTSVAAGEPAGTGTPGGAGGWSPGGFTDEQLAARIGARMLTAARRVFRTGYVARVHRSRPGDPVPTVELPTATVRFLVPHDLGFARTDAEAGVRDDVLALAVWAFRVADEQVLDESDAQVQVGGGPAAVTGTAGLERAAALAGLVLREGAVHLGSGINAEIATVRRELETARMRWPLLAVDDLVAQLDAYRERSARYQPEALADHVAELFARHRTVTRGGASLASRVLGTGEASETPLRRARLDGLGARVSVTGDERTVEVFLAHADSSTVLVLRRSFPADTSLADRRVAGVTLGALAAGAVVTESASRSASRTVRLGTRRLSRTEAMASRGSWQDLPRTVLAPDLAVLSAELAGLPPRPVRARVAAELIRVVPIAEVRQVTYAPGAQRVDAVIADESGVTATVTAVHAACAPGRLDAVVAALAGGARFVAGHVRRAGGGVVVDPIGFAGGTDETSGDNGVARATGRGSSGPGGGVIVPDLAAAARSTDPRDRPALVADPLGQAVDDVLALLAEVAHRGLLHLPSSTAGRLRAAGERLGRVGLRRVGESIAVLAGLLGPDPGDAAVEAWADAYLRVSTAADLRP